jgi:hypothetical protein
MQRHRFAVTMGAFFAVTGFIWATPLNAQAAIPAGSVAISRLGELPPVNLLAALSRYRVTRWANASPVIHCSPAPLTELPGARSEFARPHVIPLEEAFADAASVRRAVALRAGQMALEN